MKIQFISFVALHVFPVLVVLTIASVWSLAREKNFSYVFKSTLLTMIGVERFDYLPFSKKFIKINVQFHSSSKITPNIL